MTTARELIESGGMGGYQLKARSEDERKAAFMEVDADPVQVEVEPEPVEETVEQEAAPVEASKPETDNEALLEAAKAVLRGQVAEKPRTEPAPKALDAKVVERLKDALGEEAEAVIALLEQSNSATQALVEMQRQQMVSKYVKQYSEISRPAVMGTVAGHAARIQRPGESDDSAFGRALVELYGDRRGEAKRQAQGQMSPVRRTEKTTQPMTTDAANQSAIEAYFKTGSVAQAQKLRSDLLR